MSQGCGIIFKEEFIMVVQHNMQAVNTNRMLGQNVKAVQKSTEKLSSGYQVNRAADDAAGLSILLRTPSRSPMPSPFPSQNERGQIW